MATSRLNLSLNTFASYDETHNGDYEQAINARFNGRLRNASMIPIVKEDIHSRVEE